MDKRLIIGIIIGAVLLSAGSVYALPILTAPQGGTGIGSATAGDVGKVLTVSDDSPFTYTLSTASGGGVGTSTDPFMATYFVATSTTATSSLPNLSVSNIQIGSDYVTDFGNGLSVNGSTGVVTATLGTTIAPNELVGQPFPANVLLGINSAGTGFVATGTPQLTVGNLLATSTTATSTFAGGLNVTSPNGGSVKIDYLTASELLATDANKALQSLSVSTYPSLTELTYVKGVTSAIQTQLGTKLQTDGVPTQYALVMYSDTTGTLVQDSLINTDGNGTLLLDDNTFTVRDGASPTRQFQFEASGISLATTRVLTVPNADGTIALLTSTVASASDLTCTNCIGATEINDLDVASGGTGASTLTGLLQGNGTSAFTAITNSSTVGQVLRVTGASTYAWGALDVADTDAVTGTLPVGNGGTGAATYGQGWLHTVGGTTAFTASTSPTVNYLTATSTTATSTFAGPVLLGNLSGVASSSKFCFDMQTCNTYMIYAASGTIEMWIRGTKVEEWNTD